MTAPRRIRYLAALAVAALLAVSWLSGLGRSIQVRVDTGAVRFQFVSLTYRTIPQMGYVIPRLQLVTRLSPPIEARWASVWRWRGLDVNDYWRVREEYARASAWCGVNPAFGRLVLDDLVRWVTIDDWNGGFPECDLVLAGLVVRNSSGRYTVAPGWQQSSDLEHYLEDKGPAARELLGLGHDKGLKP